MTLVESLLAGFSVAATPSNLLFCLLGVTLGTLIGVLPGLGPTATISLLLPFTFGLDPVTSLIMLAGIYYGAQYGGSTTAILINLPGEASSVVTCLDGYQMARQGRAGTALTIAALGSLFAGIVGSFVIALWGPVLADFARGFSSPEYFALMVLGLVAAIVLAQGSLLNAIAAIMMGMFIGLIGIDRTSGVARYTFGQPELFDGIGFVPVAMGVFGLVEIAVNLEQTQGKRQVLSQVGRLWLTRDDVAKAYRAVLRGTGIGCLLGILPGGGAVLGSFASYALERRVSRDPARFGHGAIEGVAGPESANNAAAQTSFIPLLTLGIPSNGIMALLMGAMMVQGIAPGPEVMTSRPELFWGLIASMLIGNLLLVVINLPMIGIWVKLLHVPYRILFPTILIVCCVGVYTLNNSIFEVVVMAGFGVFGYAMRKSGCEGAPFLLGLILGPLMEEHLRRAMLISFGDPSVFVTRPVSAVLLLIAVLLFAFAVIPSVSLMRAKTFEED
ncbi:tripartite tricarboxylate transporter permease [Bradyrhizobium sp. LHD-71]|uniref:tripartite tricarboxylate transporter permease n=1 Tax=Bradyrhizobium sp. LHD-71 TaxID=3072141 RepID=UPI0028101FC6|nr:tripartite tricarboxylate transporter permease [Bradyrhizobium sp. LHD-71]MDQ8728215.1 tripartite tricarboxylate transporter permease [Bradyrhizobium sp. LHD-71]